MVRVISQETFDAAVRENREDFEMELEEAVREAREQFQAQGVDLSNIVVSTSSDVTQEEDHLVVQAIKALEKLKEEQEVGAAQLHEPMGVITEECGRGLAERVLATKHGAYHVLVHWAQKRTDCRLAVLNALTALLDGNPDSLDELGVTFLLLALSSDGDGDDAGDDSCLEAALDCVLNCCVRHEDNRQTLVRRQLLDKLDPLFARHPVGVTRVWQALVQDDDVRVPFGQAHQNARQIVEEHQALAKLTEGINASAAATPDCTDAANSEADLKKTKSLALAHLSCLSSLCVRNEYCQAVVDEGGLKCLLSLLIQPDQSREVVFESLKLIKALAGNDNVKKDINKLNGIQVVVNAMNKYASARSVCTTGCSALTSICLRSPDNAQHVMQNGGAQMLTKILRTHMDHEKVVAACSNAIRNIVSRSKQFSADFVAHDAEPLLNEVMQRHPKAEQAAKAALRDLGLKVALKEQWTGGLVKNGGEAVAEAVAVAGQ